MRIGVMGMASIARRSVLPAIRALTARFHLVAIASRDLQKARVGADEFGCDAVEGYDALLARSDVDAVYMPLPTGLHDEWIHRALEAGKHVYAEKSIAPSFPVAQRMVAAARERGLALMEGYMFLYHSQQARAKALVESGVVGEIRHFSAAFGFPPLPETDFRYDAAVGGGALLDAAGYPLRATHYLLGSGFRVQAATMFISARRGTSIFGSAFLGDGSGVGASISFGFDNFYQCRYEVWGSKAKLTATRAFTAGPSFVPQLLIDRPEGTEVINVPADNHFVGALEEFAAIIADPVGRKRHYAEILTQSEALQRINDLAGAERGS